ncbi:MAG TPA: LCP family protein [Atribacteraceae bacterium]|nr:LCP family protein [Atribacteraceae bacterium]
MPKTKREKKRRSYNFIFLFIGFFIGFVVLFVFNVPFRDQIFKRVMGVDSPEDTIILVVGQDGINPVRSDTIILVCLNTEAGEVLFLSVPRDSRLYLPERGYDKANHAYSRGGVELLRGTLENAFQMVIPHFVETDYKGFSKIVDALGGVEIDVEKDMYYVDRAQDLYINLSAGRQRLDGEKALQYVRYRTDPLGDIGRIERQKTFIQALIKEMENPAHLPRFPQIINELRNAFHTNIPAESIISLALWYKGLSSENLSLETLPGKATHIGGVSYWEPDLVKSRTLIEEFFAREKVLNDS